jgi:multidrug efflux pump subunit AcrA (membrane-fusion protein)
MIAQRQISYWLAILALFCLAFLAVSCGGSKANARPGASASPTPAAIEVTTAPAIQRQLARYFEATGSLAGDVQTDVQPQTAGKVVAVGVDLGSYVRRGQMIARIEDADYKLRLDQAVAQLENAKAAVRQAEEKIGLKPGQNFDPEKVAEVAVARATYDLAEKNLSRAEKLIESGMSRARMTAEIATRA